MINKTYTVHREPSMKVLHYGECQVEAQTVLEKASIEPGEVIKLCCIDMDMESFKQSSNILLVKERLV